MTATAFLARWFELMDSDTPEKVLELIADDFTMSLQFSKGAGKAAEFTASRASGRRPVRRCWPVVEGRELFALLFGQG